MKVKGKWVRGKIHCYLENGLGSKKGFLQASPVTLTLVNGPTIFLDKKGIGTVLSEGNKSGL
jgi:hypothetical protein